MVIDSYVLPRDAYSAVRRVRPTLAIVDGDPAGKDGHVLVDQNIGAEDDDWPLPDGAVRLAGLDYALMRDEIRDARTARHDPATGAVAGVRVLRRHRRVRSRPRRSPAPWSRPERPSTSGWSPPPTRCATSCPASRQAPGQQVTVLAPTNALAAEVTAADLVVSAAGTSSWELLCLGAACAFVCVADNQETSYDRVVAAGAVAGVGRLGELRADPSGGIEVLATLLGDEAERVSLRAAGSSLVDGRGRERVAEALAAHVQSG